MNKSKNKKFIIITIVVILLDLIFVSINYDRAKNTLNESLIKFVKKEERAFNVALALTYRNLKLVSKYYSHNSTLNNLFREGKEAVEAEGGGAGGNRAKKIRNEILGIIERDWNLMSQEFQFKQFQYHLAPGSLSFLRVHEPNKFGDRMDNLRYIIVDTNLEKKSKIGFETGRVSSGLRAVEPIWSVDPKTNKNVYVGALEIGTSFAPLLSILTTNNSVKSNFTILLTKEHIKKHSWPGFHPEKMKQNQSRNYFIEANTTLDSDIQLFVDKSNLSINSNSQNVQFFQLNEKYIATYAIPFKDYVSTKDAKLPPIGFVFISSDVTDLVDKFHTGFYINILFAIITFLIIEVTLLLLFRYENKLKKSSLHDYLTKLPNRSYFKEYAQRQLALAERKKEKLAILFFDLDNFKGINDGISHEAGDFVLKTISTRCKEFIRRNEFIARIGGDEFCMVIYGYNDDLELKRAASRLIKSCSEEIILDGNSIKQGISVGIARYPIDATSLDELIHKSDIAMYSVKNNKKGSYAFISEHL